MGRVALLQPSIVPGSQASVAPVGVAWCIVAHGVRSGAPRDVQIVGNCSCAVFITGYADWQLPGACPVRAEAREAVRAGRMWVRVALRTP